MTATFCHLHVHTEFSALDGLARLKGLVGQAKKLGFDALAITDHGNLAGVYKFVQACKAEGVKPIIGEEVYLAIGGDRHNPGVQLVEYDDEGGAVNPDEDDDEKVEGQENKKKKVYEHLTLIATNTTGWRNLVRMTNEAEDSFKSKPLMDYRLIKKYGEGIIILTGCLGGPIIGPLSRGDVAEAEANLDQMIDAVGKSNVFIEVMDHGIPSEERAVDGLIELACRKGVPMVATNDSHFIEPDQHDAHDAWTAMQSKKTLDDPKAFKFNGHGYHLRSEEEMRALFDGEEWWQDACDNTMHIAGRIDADVLPKPGYLLPSFPVPEGFSGTAEYLTHLVWEGAEKRYGSKRVAEDVSLRARINHELDTICGRLGGPDFSAYFLIVWELIGWARGVGILVGAGRGSAAGSVVSYSLQIVNVDPIKYNLLFERFMEPGRTDMPDIDIDFQASRRDEVIMHLQDRYGKNSVARIGSFQIPKSPGAIKMAFKVMGLPVRIAEVITKQIPRSQGRPDPISKLEDEGYPGGATWRDEVAKAIAADPRCGDAIELARSFEGVVQNTGIHACGIIVTDIDLRGYIPMRLDRHAEKRDSKVQIWISQWDSKDTEAYGLLKMDALVLRNLDVADTCCQIVTASDTPISIDTLPDPDDARNPMVRNAMALVREGRNAGVFQVESDGMIKLGQEMQPDSLDDISALLAMYRPGPLSAGMPEHYARRKAGLEPVDYSIFSDDPEEQRWIASVLDETYGVFCYQEQVMRLSTVVAGFTAAERSKLRKAIGKKIRELMDEVGKKFIAQAGTEFYDNETGELISPKFSPATAERVWKLMEGNADYLFNKSHSTAYGWLTFVTAYLKANWPVQFGAALLANTDKNKADTRLSTMKDLEDEGIEVCQPSINGSHHKTSVSEPDEDGVRKVLLGLAEVRGVGDPAKWIVHEREANGPFTSLANVVERVKSPEGAAISVSVLESLVEAGAFDEFGPRLGQFMVARSGGVDPLDAEWGVLERSIRQRSRLGIAIGESPLLSFRETLSSWTVPLDSMKNIGNGGRPVGLHRIGEGLAPDERKTITTLGVLTRWSERPFKGGRMASFSLEGTRGSVDGVVWNDDLMKMKQAGLPNVGEIIVVRGAVRKRLVEMRPVAEADPDMDDQDTDEESLEVEVEPVVVERIDLAMNRFWRVEVDDPDLAPNLSPDLPVTSVLESLAKIDTAALVASKPKRRSRARVQTADSPHVAIYRMAGWSSGAESHFPPKMQPSKAIIEMAEVFASPSSENPMVHGAAIQIRDAGRSDHLVFRNTSEGAPLWMVKLSSGAERASLESRQRCLDPAYLEQATEDAEWLQVKGYETWEFAPLVLNPASKKLQEEFAGIL